jgi:hypothetical protein
MKRLLTIFALLISISLSAQSQIRIETTKDKPLCMCPVRIEYGCLKHYPKYVTKAEIRAILYQRKKNIAYRDTRYKLKVNSSVYNNYK